jgi:ketosteroid isomerase-like protein
MILASDPESADRQFFTSLLEADANTLDRLLSDDFLLVDVMQGGVIQKVAFLELIGAKQLVFKSITPSDPIVRLFGATAIIIGRTRMKGLIGETPFTVESRYTHVFVRQSSQWRMVTAQGTPIAAAHPME